jgi:hypothetical protein
LDTLDWAKAAFDVSTRLPNKVAEVNKTKLLDANRKFLLNDD